MRNLVRFGAILAIWLVAAWPIRVSAAEPTKPTEPTKPNIEFRDGDRVVLLGGTFVERLQVHGYLETLLTTGLADRRITFRNLGWSGDTVWGDARAVFGQQADGFKRLVKDTQEAQPTLILLCYGANEANAGAPGLKAFDAGFQRLLEALAPTKARIVVLLPPAREKLPSPLPDPSAYNANLQLYTAIMWIAARQRNCETVDLIDILESPPVISDPQGQRPLRLTDNSLHLNELGQAIVGARIAKRLGVAFPSWRVALDATKPAVDAQGVTVRDLEKTATGVTFKATARQLPLPPVYQNRLPGSAGHTASTATRVRLPEYRNRLTVSGLAPGNYELIVDGRAIEQASHEMWAQGVSWELSADVEQAEQLRRTIYDKNVLYFHRYRPQNETYLFLFRKHEQGNNAVEIPQFDPLVAEKEQQIAKLSRPAEHQFELKRQ